MGESIVEDSSLRRKRYSLYREEDEDNGCTKREKSFSNQERKKKQKESATIIDLEDLDMLPFDYDYIKKAKVIGMGAFGKVLKVCVNGSKYAVKRVDTKSIESTKCLLKEVNMLKSFCNNMSHIVHFKGVFGGCEFYDDGKPKEIFMMIEYLPGENMKKYLETDHTEYMIDEKLRDLLDVANALEALHSKNIIHGDLSLANIMKRKAKYGGECVLVDFGASRKLVGATSESVSGTCPFLSPEQHEIDDNGTPSEVFVFGLIMFCVLSGSTAPFFWTSRESLGERVIDGERPDKKLLPPSITQNSTFVNMLDKCWSYNPTERPSISLVKDELLKVSNMYVQQKV